MKSIIMRTTFVDYERHPHEYHLSSIQTVLHTHTRVTLAARWSAPRFSSKPKTP